MNIPPHQASHASLPLTIRIDLSESSVIWTLLQSQNTVNLKLPGVCDTGHAVVYRERNDVMFEALAQYFPYEVS